MPSRAFAVFVSSPRTSNEVPAAPPSPQWITRPLLPASFSPSVSRKSRRRPACGRTPGLPSAPIGHRLRRAGGSAPSSLRRNATPHLRLPHSPACSRTPGLPSAPIGHRLRCAGGSAHRPLAADCLPRKAPGPSCRRRRTADVAKHPFALRRPPADLGPSGALHARPGGNGLRFPDVVPTRPTSKYAPYYTRLVGNVPAPTSPAPLRANPDRTRAVAGIHPRTSAVPDVSAAVGPSFAAGSAPTFGATGGSVSSMRNSPSRSFCQSRIYP